MFKKVYNIVFIVLFLSVFTIPLIFTKWEKGGVSVDENRNLAKFPDLVSEGKFNDSFTKQFDNWFMDHMGLRQEMITANATLQLNVFNRLLSQSDYKLGRDGDINYAPDAIIRDYAHVNLLSDEEIEKIGQSYQVVSDWVESKGIPFYYVQCYDKHSIYPEQFMDTVKQVGSISRLDQIIDYVEKNTTVETISLKQVLLDNKSKYEVYSNWGDPAHWSPRGAYIGYKYTMERINETSDFKYKILQESDYKIKEFDQGITLNNVIHREDILEYLSIENGPAYKTDVSVMGKWASDYRHAVWVNPEADNDQRLLLMGDSYFKGFLLDDFAQSFSEVWMVWGDHAKELDEIIEFCEPDIVIYESAERVDRTPLICALAEKIKTKRQ